MNKVIHIFSKILLQAIIRLNYGNGSTIPGHFALYLNKNILKWYFKKIKKGVVLVTGTNGKTTTTHIIKKGLIGLGQKVIFSNNGANLENGIVSSFVKALPYFSNGNYDYGVFEVDELNLQIILKNVTPKSIIFLNLSRDQLDRYAELDHILSSWQESISNLTNTDIYVYNKDPYLQKLKGKNIKTFSKNANLVSLIKGDFNNINLSASYKVLLSFFPKEKKKITNLIKNFTPVFGRGEKFRYNNNEITLLLNKNPESFNENLKLLTNLSTTYPQKNNIVAIGLNNNIADGKDISWIYDVKTVLIQNLDKNISKWVCLGGRYLDIANRLKYAGIKENKIVLVESFFKFKEYINGTQNKNYWVLPTYTSMLRIRSVFGNSSLGKSINA